jgi:ribonuclease HI
MEVLDENALNIYADGSSLSHPRRGGIGYRFVTVGEDGHEVTHDSAHPGYREATNQQMELLACIKAINEATGRNAPFDLSRYTKIVIYTDSQYVVENLNNARSSWPHADWTTADGTPLGTRSSGRNSRVSRHSGTASASTSSGSKARRVGTPRQLTSSPRTPPASR